MPDVDTTNQQQQQVSDQSQAQQQQQAQASKAEPSAEEKARTAAAAKDKTAEVKEQERKAAEELEAKIEAEADKRAQKLAEKRAKDIVAAKEQEAQKLAERAKLDVAEQAKLAKADAEGKAAELTAKLAAAELRNELQGHMLLKGLAPATDKSMKYITDAVSEAMKAGSETLEKAIAKVQKDEPNLFAAKQVLQDKAGEQGQQRQQANTAGAAGGGSERPANEQTGSEQRQYKTKPPGELIGGSWGDLNASVRERYGIDIPGLN
jgi:hypothetical protein